MMTPEIAQDKGLAIKNKTTDSVLKRGCPTFLDNAFDALMHFGESEFQYKRDLQVEALIKGHVFLRDSPHVSQYKKIMEQVKYGDNPDIRITGEQIANKDRFVFSGSIIKRPIKFVYDKKTSDSLYALSEKIDLDENNVDYMAYTIGCQDMMSEIPSELLNSRNKELLKTLTDECIRIERFLELRTLHKIIEHTPVQADYNERMIRWTL